MKKALPLLSLLTLGIFLFLFWKRNSTPKPAPVETKLEVTKPSPTPTPIKKAPQVISKKKKVPKIKKQEPVQRVLPTKTFSERDEISVHLQDSKGNLIITAVTIVDDLVIAHGDIIVGQVKDLDRFINKANSGEPLILPKATLWKDGIVPYVIDDELPNTESVQEAIRLINSKTSLKWIPKTDEQNYVRFKIGPLNCYSPLGMIGGEQTISLASGCKKGQVVHEMLHTLGLLHEQNREDRDEYISILWENIEQKNHLQFKKIKNTNLDLKKHPFDFNSIMLYAQSAFSQFEGDFTIVRVNGDSYEANKDSLSSGDLKKLNSLYPIDKN